MTLVAASMIVFFLLAGTDVQAFDIQDSLHVQQILATPQISPDGSRIAYLANDWQEDASVLAHKPTGKLFIKSVNLSAVKQNFTSREDEVLSEHASDPVWSHSGQLIAYFEGVGETRSLAISTIISKSRDASDKAVRVATPGEPSRKSGLGFAPVWGPSDRYVYSAEAVKLAPPPSPSEPFSISSSTAQLPNDAHFRTAALWRVFRLDLKDNSKEYLSAPIALRKMLASPLGNSFVLAVARHQAPGMFLGDDYALPHDYLLLSPGSNLEFQPLANDQIAMLLGWSNEATLLVRSPPGLQSLDVSTREFSSLGGWPFKHSSKGHSLLTNDLAVWGKTPPLPQQYLIPPASPDIMTVMQLGKKTTRELISASENQEILQAFWLHDGKRLLIHTRDLQSFNEKIMLWSPAGMQTVFEAAASIGLLSNEGKGSNLAFSLQDADALPELHILNLNNSQLKTISKLNQLLTQSIAAKGGLVAPDIISGTGPEGTPWRALLYLPSDAKPTQPIPLVVSAYGRKTDLLNQFNAEAQMHTSQGYAYLMPDVHPLRGQLHLAYAEVIPSAIAVAREQYNLHGRSGFFGGSLGGYAGLVLITRSTVIDAAVLRAAPSEFAMSWATGKDRDADLLEYLMLNTTPFESTAAYLEDSPFWMADKVTAATLFLHGTDDAQVPLEQSEWMFQSLRRLGKATAELRVYPDADHSIVRGNVSFYQDYYRQLFAWWQQHLQTEVTDTQH